VVKRSVGGRLELIIRGRGRRITISMSKIKKITVMRKNCREKGRRAE